MTMTPRRRSLIQLGLICLIFGLFGLAYNLAVPLHKAPDEIAHFQYARFIAQTGRLPLTPAEREQAGYLSFWPPAYHAAVAALTGWASGEPLPRLKFVWESPRFELARELLDTKRLANTEDEWWPYQGDALLWHLGRLVTTLFSLGTVIVVYFTALEIWPGRYSYAVGSAALAAFIPTFTFLSGVMSYDPLLGGVVGLYFWLLVRIFKGDTRLRNLIGVGLLLGLAVTVKYTAVILPLEVVTVLGYAAWRWSPRWSRWVGWVALAGGAAIVASGWWFGFLVVYFNEIATYGWWAGALKPILAGGIDASQNYTASLLTGVELGAVDSTFIISDPFSAWVAQMYQSIWVMDIGNAYPLALPAFVWMGLVIALGLVGLGLTWRWVPRQRAWVVLLAGHTAIFFTFPLLRFWIQGNVVWTAQGRHVLFPLATSLPLLWLFGLDALLSPRRQRILVLVVMAGLLTWNLAQLGRVAGYYENVYTWLPIRTTPAALDQIEHRLDHHFGQPSLHLVGYTLPPARPDGALKLSLFWQVDEYLPEDYRLRLSLLQPGQPDWQWRTYPLNGGYPTRIWEPGELIRDDVVWPVGDVPPGSYQLVVQIEGVTGPLPVDGGETGLPLTEISFPTITPPPPAIVLPIVADGRPVVEGVTLWQGERYRLGDLPEYRPRMNLSLVWRGQPAPGERVDWLLIDPQGQPHSARPVSARVAAAEVGADWPAGAYRLRAEVWRNDAVLASQETGPVLAIKNERPRRVTPPPIEQPVSANFANQIELLGYNLPVRALSAGDALPVTLYWQGLRTTDQSYTVFAKLLDQTGRAWASVERLPADGYPTYYWLENEVVVDGFALPVNPTTPDGVYWLNVGLYQQLDGAAVSLPLLAARQPTGETSVTVGPVKIGGPPLDVLRPPLSPSPQTKMSLDLGQPPVIRLRGYDLARDNVAANLTLYWESMAPTPADWSIFVHLRDAAGQTVAQNDGPAGGGNYPTSLWDAGETIPDTLTVPLPDNLPPGTYQLVVGLYNLADGTRLTVPGTTDNSLLLTTIELK